VRAFLEVGATPPDDTSTRAPGSLTDVERLEIELLRDQLGRMRAMLYKYTHEFFTTIHLAAAAAVGLLVLGSVDGWGAAVLVVPFLVPFAFLETAYLFFYTVFARRHAERLEQALNERLGRDALVAHRLEAAYFYPPDRPKITFISLGSPLGFSSVMTVGYSVAAGMLWVAGVVLSVGFVAGAATGGLIGIVVPAQVVWTVAIAAFLVWYSLTRRDEDRLVRLLATSYRVPGASEPAAGMTGTAASRPASSDPDPSAGPGRTGARSL
jgi:hypothetical protein